MRTVTTKVFTFDELTEESKNKAIENTRQSYYEYNDFAQWVIDDCALLEPKHQELEDLFGSDYDFPLLKNNRTVYYSLDRDRHIDISNAMEVQNDIQFLRWLGLTEELINITDYVIGEDSIEFDVDMENECTEEQQNILGQAQNKFENHCEDILNRIETDYNYRFTDEAIIEDINADDYEFLENGNIF